MIINNVTIRNFGLYKGEIFFDLKPSNLEGRNVTIISGQNGSGKSTLMEAVHLALLGSLAIDERVSEQNYEQYLKRRCYQGEGSDSMATSIELNFEFVKSGEAVAYKVLRSWNNRSADAGEDIRIEENGVAVSGLSKKEKNLFLRELVQPGLARVMFFDGEKLLSLYDRDNLAAFIRESCRYLFGLNFVDLLQTDLNYYIQKLQGQQDPGQHLTELEQIKQTLSEIQNHIVAFGAEQGHLMEELVGLRLRSQQTERQISDQGRWAGGKQNQLKAERQQLEKEIVQAKKELIELYNNLGPFVFCRDLCLSLRDRLVREGDAEKRRHAGELISKKLGLLKAKLGDPAFLKQFSMGADHGQSLFPAIKSILIDEDNQAADAKIYLELSAQERERLIAWIDEVTGSLGIMLVQKSSKVAGHEERLKAIAKELSSFSSEDRMRPLLTELQEVNKAIGAGEQKLEGLSRRLEENSRRKEFYSQKLLALEQKMLRDGNLDERLGLSRRTGLVLEGYRRRLTLEKLELLRDKVLEKFNLLCRKDSYLDELFIDAETFELRTLRQGVMVDHAHLSAGEKQLLVLSIVWGLRELTNIALPLIIDTPLARLDLEHRRTFIERFLPAIQPQVILIGTDMELDGEMPDSLAHHLAHRYTLTYDREQHATHLSDIGRTKEERTVHEI